MIVEPPRSSLSDKDLELVVRTYRRTSELYLENKTSQNYLHDLIAITALVPMIFVTRTSSNGPLLSQMEILRARVRQCPALLEPLDKAIAHLQRPVVTSLGFEQLKYCLENSSLFTVGCTVAIRYYESIASHPQFDWKTVIEHIGQNIAASPALGIELLHLLCEGNEFHSKLTVKSGAIRYLFSSFILSNLKDKLNLYKAIKLLKIVASADRSILREKERVIATVIVSHEDYIPILADLCLKCYDVSYAGEIASRQTYEVAAIDQPFVWSYAEPFCQGISKITIQNVKKMWKNANGELEAKIYAILANYSRYCKECQLQLTTMLPRHQESLLNYLKMCLSLSQIDSSSPKILDWNYLDKLAEANPSAKVAQLLKYLKELAGKDVKVGSLSLAQKSLYNTDKNMDLMLQKASRIPKTNEQLQDLRHILSQKPSSNEFQSDNLRIAKQKAITSLQKAITQKNPLKLNSLLSGVELSDVVLVARILNIVQLHLMMNETAAEEIDLDRILEMIEWIEKHYDGEIIDWGSIGQLLIMLCEESQWVKHMKHVPELNYWILGIEQAEGKAQALVWSTVQKAFTTQDTRKLSLMVGFLGKVLTPVQKFTFISKFSKVLHQMQTNLQQGKYYKLTLMMLSYFIKGWHQIEQDSENWKSHNQKFEVLISPLVKIVLANFRSLPQEYRFLENCLPYPISSAQLLPHVDSLVSTHGKLSAYLSKQQTRLGRKPQLAPDRLINLDSLPPSGVLQTLIFLQANDDMVKAAELNKISSLSSKKDSYWQLYPNYVNIVSHLIQIVGQTDNANVKPSLTDLTVQLVNQVEDNPDSTAQQKEELFGEIKTSLESMKERGVYIEIERVRKVVTRIIEEQIREEIIYILSNYKCKQPPPPPPPPKPQPQEDVRKYVSMKPRQQIAKPAKKQMSLSLSSLDLEVPSMRQISSSASIMLMPDERGDREEFVQKEKVNVDTQLVEMRQKEPSSLLEASQILNRIVNKQESPQKYDNIHDIFMNNNISEPQRDLLGELLAKFYSINPNVKALTLLSDKQKTNLAKEQVYDLIAEDRAAFILVRRWKVLSRQGLDIAMLRIGQGFMADACQVAQYNLSKTADLQYFYAKKYHLIVIRHLVDVNGEDAAEYYLRLIGASARLPQVRQQYLAHSIHLKIVKLLRAYDTSRITAAYCYAMASLLFEQQQSCLDIARDTNNLKFMLTSIRREKTTPTVVYPASCFLANMTYSNSEVKETLRVSNIVTLLMSIFENNLTTPDVASLKQLLRAMGNLSISKQCSQELIGSRFCECAVRMAEGLDIFIEFDEKKAKVVKLLIDLVANIATQRTGLHIMHRQKITLLIITLLETTERDVAILGGCIDTVDALCQDEECENYLVAEKRLPWILIDILKIQEDSLILLKTARLLTNLTLHNGPIPYILKSNLLGVVANIVLPHAYGGGVAGDQLKKLQAYAVKALTRVHQVKPPLDVLLKSGFLECLLRVVESAAVEDSFIELLFDYSSHLPNFLSKRGFSCLIRILTARVNSATVLQKCIRSFKNILGFSYDREDEDIVISGIPQMYEKFLQSQYLEDALFLLGFHLLRSHQLRVILKKREDRVFDSLTLLSKQPELTDTCKSLIFLIYNPRISLWLEDFGPNSEEEFYKIMRNGFPCYLYRADGSYKAAKLDLDEEYNIRAYKQPDGEIKRKYTVNIRYVKDLQLDYAHNEQLWRQTAFSVERGMFDSHLPAANLCATLVGNAKWGEINFINVEFVKEDDKLLFYRALSHLLAVFRG